MHFMCNALACARKRGKRGRSLHRHRLCPGHVPSSQRAIVSVADKLRPALAKPGALMDAAEEDVLGDMTFLLAHRTKLHSTDPIGRLNHEVQPAHGVGILPNEDAIGCLLGAVLVEQTDDWAVQRARYTLRDMPSDVLKPATSELPVMAH